MLQEMYHQPTFSLLDAEQGTLKELPSFINLAMFHAKFPK